MRRRSLSQEPAIGSPSYSNGGGQVVNCATNGNGLLGSHATESNSSSRGSNCSLGSSASSTSSRGGGGGGAGEQSDRSSSREDRATTPNCNKLVVVEGTRINLLIHLGVHRFTAADEQSTPSVRAPSTSQVAHPGTIGGPAWSTGAVARTDDWQQREQQQ